MADQQFSSDGSEKLPISAIKRHLFRSCLLGLCLYMALWWPLLYWITPWLGPGLAPSVFGVALAHWLLESALEPWLSARFVRSACRSSPVPVNAKEAWDFCRMLPSGRGEGLALVSGLWPGSPASLAIGFLALGLLAMVLAGLCPWGWHQGLGQANWLRPALGIGGVFCVLQSFRVRLEDSEASATAPAPEASPSGLPIPSFLHPLCFQEGPGVLAWEGVLEVCSILLWSFHALLWWWAYFGMAEGRFQDRIWIFLVGAFLWLPSGYWRRYVRTYRPLKAYLYLAVRLRSIEATPKTPELNLQQNEDPSQCPS